MIPDPHIRLPPCLFRDEDLDRAGFGVYSSEGFFVDQDALVGPHFPLLEDEMGRNAGLRRRDRTPTRGLYTHTHKHTHFDVIFILLWYYSHPLRRTPTYFPGDPRQVTHASEWLADPQESGVYKRGSRGITVPLHFLLLFQISHLHQTLKEKYKYRKTQ